MKIVERDILTVAHGLICHQTNCQGSMGAGLALQIAKKWPNVEKFYVDSLAFYKRHGMDALGQCSSTQVGPMLHVVNIYGQNYYGGRNVQNTSYEAVNKAFDTLYQCVTDPEDALYDLQVYAPWQMGCFRGGGDWNIYKEIIEKYFPNVIYCKYKG